MTKLHWRNRGRRGADRWLHVTLRRSLLLSCAVGAAFCSGEAAAAAADKPASVEVLVVTAEKRPEDVQQVPISLNVITEKQLETFNVSDFLTLQTSIPSMVIHTSPVSTGIYLRGFGSAGSNPSFDASVSLYQDGVYMGLARQEMAPFFDVAQIEVLRGPQGALVGKNTAAGAITITTNDPTRAFEGSATASYDVARHGAEAFGYVSGPITDTLSGRLAVQFVDLDGWIHNDATGTDDPRKRNAVARLSLKYQPSGRFDVTTKLEFGSFGTRGSAQVLISPTVRQELPDTKNAADGFAVAPHNGEYSKQNGYNSATVANWHIGDFTLRSITGFSGFTMATNTFAAPLNPEMFGILWAQNFDQQSEELQLFSPLGRPIEFIAGAYVDHSHQSFQGNDRYNVFGGLFNGQQHSAFHQQESSASVFASATWHVTDDLRLLGSARYTWIHKKATFAFIDDFDTGVLPELLGPPHSTRGSLSESHFDPSITAQYDLTPDVMVFASYARGSKGGGFDAGNNAVTAANFAYRPEDSADYEVGVKSSFLERRVVIDISLYHLHFKNLQVSGFDPRVVALSTTNAASATSKGVEATLAWQATDQLKFSSSAAYTNAVYDDYPGAKCTAAQPSPPCTPPNNNIKGRVLQFVPKWSGDLQMDYSAPISSKLVFGATIAATYRSSVWVDDNNYDPVIGLQGSAIKWDARLQIGPPDGGWNVALVGRNLTNKLVRSYAYDWPLEFGPKGAPLAVAIVDEGRSIAIQASTKF